MSSNYPPGVTGSEPQIAGWSSLEAVCRKCGETFIPSDEDDTIHGATELGAPCGGQGEVVGEWSINPPVVTAAANYSTSRERWECAYCGDPLPMTASGEPDVCECES